MIKCPTKGCTATDTPREEPGLGVNSQWQSVDIYVVRAFSPDKGLRDEYQCMLCGRKWSIRQQLEKDEPVPSLQCREGYPVEEN